MAEPISLASGILALTTFAIQSSKGLYDAFDSFQSNQRTVRETKEELQDLLNVLKALGETLQKSEADLSTLKLPLLRCGETCTRFIKIINECSARSNGSRTSVRDWIKFNYRGRDISSFKILIASYKSTIMIALADANLRVVGVTAQLLQQYKVVIKETTTDLEDLLDDTDIELQQTQSSTPLSSETGATSIQQMREERASIEHCLKICIRVSDHIDQIQTKDFQTTPGGSTDTPTPLKDAPRDQARYMTEGRLNECKKGIGFTVSDLRLQLRDVNRRLEQIPKNSSQLQDSGLEAREVQEEMDSLKQCLSICVDATEQLSHDRVNVFEELKSGDDIHQIIVSTMGDLISAKNITVGSRVDQWMGQIDKESFQLLAKTRGDMIRDTVRPLDHVTGVKFENRHGVGRTLSNSGEKY